MSCRNDVYMRKIGVNKLDKSMEVDFDVQRNLPDCRRINASRYASTDAVAPTYSMYTVPENQIECMQMACVNSGTLKIGTGKSAIYKAENGAGFANGVITFYVTSDVTVAEVIVSDTQALTNGDKYTARLGGASAGGFKLAVVDLTEAGTDVGTGWTPSDGYAYISIKLTGGADAGLSSIAVFEDMEDLMISTHVKVSCLTSIDGSWDLDVAESACFDRGYDTSTRPSFEKTIEGTKVTANYWRLNPMYKRGSAVQGFDIVTVERTIQSTTISGTSYGVVVIEDMNQNECGFFSAMLATAPCVDGEATLDKISLPLAIALDEKHYVLGDAGSGVTNVIFNSRLVGQKALISYPRVASVEEFLISADDVNEVRTRMSYVKKHTDGFKYRFVYNNVLVTSFPDTIGEDETSFSFTISIQPDEQGNYGRAYRIID